MGLRYAIHRERRLVRVVGEGLLTLRQLQDHLLALSEDPRYVAPMLKLVDLRRAALTRLAPEDVHAFTDLKACLARHFVAERCAIVVSRDVDYGIARIHAARSEVSDIETRVFKELAPAVAWLETVAADLEAIVASGAGDCLPERRRGPGLATARLARPGTALSRAR